jgi:hypothetical protein
MSLPPFSLLADVGADAVGVDEVAGQRKNNRDPEEAIRK